VANAYHRKVLQWHPDKLETMAQELGPRIASAIHLAHAAGANGGHNLIWTKTSFAVDRHPGDFQVGGNYKSESAEEVESCCVSRSRPRRSTRSCNSPLSFGYTRADLSRSYASLIRAPRRVLPSCSRLAAFLADLLPSSRTACGATSTQLARYASRPQFQAARIFRGDRAAVQLGAKWGFIDRAGKFVVPPQFDDIK
jgi:WG containing repeat